MKRIDIKPLSVNQAWQGRRFRSQKYKDYQNHLSLLLPPKRDEYKGNLRIEIKYGFSSKLGDIDNPCKPFLDILSKKYGFNDKQVFELYQEKELVPKGKDYIEFNIIEL